VLAEIVRLDRAHHRPVAGDSELGEAIKLVARADQSLIWDRTRHILRLRSVLREFFPAAFEAFADLATPDTLELLAIPPDPDRAARMPKSKIVAVLRRANRRGVEEKAATIESVWRAPALRQPTQVQAAFAVIVTSQVRVITALNLEIGQLGEVVAHNFGHHRDDEIYASQPGLGVILGARVLAEFGDDRSRFADAKAHKNYAAPHRSPRCAWSVSTARTHWHLAQTLTKRSARPPNTGIRSRSNPPVARR
jgi:transposase